jgi:cbb3-type cytochrome oxidase subunit 1
MFFLGRDVYMVSIARMFFASALIYGILGMLLGLHMAASHDHGQMPTHAHLLVIGWVSFAIFGLFYHLFGDTVSKALSTIHLWLAELSFIGIVTGLLLYYSGRTEFEPVAAISSLAYAVSFVLFAIIALPVLRRR